VVPRHPVSIVGVLLTTVGALLFLTFFVIDMLGYHFGPYAGILFFFLFPAIFVAGLVLIPIGGWLQRRRQASGTVAAWPRIDLNDVRHRRWAFFVVIATVVNLVIISLAAYSGVEYMETVSFCGQVCHDVMEPEFTAHQDAAHSNVACVKCHVGPGAEGFVKAKLAGTRQLVGVIRGKYAQPVPTPVHNLSPANETCERCHWPEKFHGDKIKVLRVSAEDEANTETVTTMDVHVGGGSERLGIATGIHWHMNIANKVEYIATDDKRQVIPWVRVTDRLGGVREYLADGVKPEELAGRERRTMDCMDCHNRPAHTFDPTPEKAVDRRLANGEMPKLPFVRREAVAAVKEDYGSQEAANAAIAKRLTDFYSTSYKEIFAKSRQDVDRAISATQRAWGRNIFPKMKITWGNYANNIGHMDFPGCFRCHDDSHKTKDGRAIGQDCELCHKMR
jgi:nitrate/TMAO reductase-like tetraheme cytochrome c subunit